MSKIKLFNVAQSEEIEKSAVAVLRSGQLSSGEAVSNFERRFAEFNNSENTVACNDMTSALELVLNINGVGAGDEVLASPFACLSTNAAIATSGATPVWVDFKENSLSLDLEDIRRKITTKTKALILYHTAGYVCELDSIVNLCKERGIILIEDCNNALGARFQNRNVGNFGDYSVFSFYPNRFLHCVEGAMLVCRNRDDAIFARKLRRFGIDFRTFRGSDGEININSDVPVISNSKVLSNLNAAIGLAQFEQLNGKLIKVQNNFKVLNERLKSIQGIRVVGNTPDSKSIPWVMFLLVEQRERLSAHLKNNHIEVSRVHCRNDYYSGFSKSGNIGLPNLDSIEKHLLGIPCGWWLSEEDLIYIVEKIKEIY